MDKQQRKEQQWAQKQPKREYKLFVGSMKATNDAQGIIEGYLNAIGNIDYGKDRTLAGAFKRTLTNSYERKKNDGDDYLWPYLWNHDYDLIPPGGIYDANEDKNGLYIKAQLNLDYDLARNMYSSYKAGTLKKQSMGYICHQQEYVKEDGQMVRNLIEVEVLEGSGVVFPMNDLANVTGVKRDQSGLYVPRYWQGWNKGMQQKGQASGKTTWPLAPDDIKWDVGQATKDIEAWANGDWSKVAQCCFWVAKNPPEKLDDCKLWFVAKVNDKMMAVPAGIIACVGGHGLPVADIPEDEVPAVQKKIATYYKKMDMTPPWEDDGKRGKKPVDKKDFNDVHQAGKAADCLEDWSDLLNDATTTLFQIFGMSDTPESDMQDFLSQFTETVMQEWLPKATEANLGQYLNDRGYCGGSDSVYVPYSLQTGDAYGWMSRRQAGDRKAGAAFSQGNTDAIHQHVATLHDMADAQAKSMHDAADGLLDSLQGLGAPSNPSYLEQGQTGDEQGNPKSRRSAYRRKAGAEYSEDNLQMLGQHVSDLHEVADTIHQMAEDLAENTGAQTYVDLSGDPDDAKQTDVTKSASRTSARGSQHSPSSTADHSEDWGDLLSGIRDLHKTL